MRTCIALLLLSLLAQPARAQEGLVEIYERALLNDPLIREAEAGMLATSEVRAQARSRLLPSLQLSSSLGDNESISRQPPIDSDTGVPINAITSSESESDSQSLSLSLSQSVFDWSSYLSLQQSDKTIARAETDYAITQQELMIRVATAYFNVLAAEDLVAADVAAREALGQQLEQAERQFEVGLIPRTDVEEARAGYDQAAASVIASERALATAQESLREIINDYVTDLEAPIENLPLETPDPEDIETWVEIAQGQNLSLISTRMAAEIAEDDIKISRSARFPTLSLSASRSENTGDSLSTNNFLDGSSEEFTGSSDRSGTNLSLSFNLPIYQGGANRSAVQQSVYRHRASIEAVERVARQTERLTRDAYLGVVSEIERVQALRQALESARTALLATQAAEEVGQRTRVDVVNAQNNVRRQETTYAAARYEYLLNILRLKQAAGSLSEADLAEIDDWLE